jgi:hypothetical protein
MPQINQEELPISFPLRLSANLHREFTRISVTTRINKSKLARLAIEKIINEVDSIGITRLTDKLYEVAK